MDVKLAEMLCTRLCHDLTGPIGAVNNGVEFLQEEEDSEENEAISLIVSSAREAVHRLQFYRQAYGRINDEGTMSLDTYHTLVTDFFSGSKIKCQWPKAEEENGRLSVSQATGRLLLNLLIVAMGGMLKGGTITLNIEKKAEGRLIILRAQGEMLKYDPDFLRLMNGEVEANPKDPKIVHYLFVKTLADACDAKLHTEYQEGEGLRLQIMA
tara:strand:+ start:922 stop:1554 length:633 start_codon:yes stop_codon:yes gene_type:complete